MPWIGEYIKAIFNYGLIVASLIGVIAIIVEGIKIIMSFGGEKKVQGYKNIGRIVIGLVLAWSSVMILRTINPNLVNLKVH